MSTHELIDLVIGISTCIGAFILALIAGLFKFYGLVARIREEITTLSDKIVGEKVIRLIVRDEVKTAIDIHEDKCKILLSKKK